MSSTFERTQVDLVSGWLIVGAKQGKKEALDNILRTGTSVQTLCADEFSIRHVRAKNEVICFAIADGVGKHIHADIGAAEAVREGVNTLAAHFDDPAITGLEQTLAHVHQHLLTLAAENRIKASDLATTLLIGALYPEKKRLICAGVGDAFLVAEAEGQFWSFPPRESFEPNAGTFSITDKNWARIARYGECPIPVSTIVAFTDGILHVMFKVDRENSAPISVPHEEAIHVFREAIMQPDNLSRGRIVSALLGRSDDRKLMEDDRAVIIFQSLDRDVSSSSKSQSPPTVESNLPNRGFGNRQNVPSLETRTNGVWINPALTEISHKLSLLMLAILALLFLAVASFILNFLSSSKTLFPSEKHESTPTIQNSPVQDNLPSSPKEQSNRNLEQRQPKPQEPSPSVHKPDSEAAPTSGS